MMNCICWPRGYELGHLEPRVWSSTIRRKSTSASLPVSLMCVFSLPQDADRLWAVSPPAEAALRRLLALPGAELRIGWRVQRTAPPTSPHGGPNCDGSVAIPLAGASRMQLLDVLDVSCPETSGLPFLICQELALIGQSSIAGTSPAWCAWQDLVPLRSGHSAKAGSSPDVSCDMLTLAIQSHGRAIAAAQN